MALQPIQLDTLTWSQLVAAMRTRIAPDSAGLWTLHAPVDPGVTLLELYSWLLDQRIYWMDKPRDALAYAVLALLGFTPLPARAASTVLQLSVDPPTNLSALARQGTLMRLGDANPPLIFTLDRDVCVLPMIANDPVRIAVGGVDHSADLQQGRPVALLGAGAAASTVTFGLVLSSPIPAGAAGQPIGILLALRAPADVVPEWAWDTVSGTQAPAAITIAYGAAPGTWLPLTAAQINDGTDGLRRSGILQLTLPADWQPRVMSGGDAPTFLYEFQLQIGQARYTTPPQAQQIVCNAVPAHHRWRRSKSMPNPRWLPIPGNVVPLAGLPSGSSLPEYPPIEDTVALTIQERTTAGGPASVQAWAAVQDLSRSGPADREFVIDRYASALRFGDGLTGRLPVPDATVAAPIQVDYCAGGGTDGNVGAGLAWVAIAEFDGAAAPGFTAINPVRGEGGRETESLIEARLRARAGLNERDRAITAGDCENLALSTPGVAIRRAHAALGYCTDFPCIPIQGLMTVFVVPYAPREQTDGSVDPQLFVPAPIPDPGTLQAVQKRLSQGRLLGSDIRVSGPLYRPIWLAVSVATDSTLLPAARTALKNSLATFLDPLVGGTESRGWPFGGVLRPSALLEVAQLALGTSGDVLSVAVSLDPTTGGETCGDIAIDAHELPALQRLDLQVRRRTVANGVLR